MIARTEIHAVDADPTRLAIARRRGLISDDETYADGIERAARAIAECDAALGEIPQTGYEEELVAAMRDGRIGLSSQLFAAAGRDTGVAACTVLTAPEGFDGDRLRDLVAQAASASAAGLGCGMDVSSFPDPGEAATRLNEMLLPVHRKLVAAGSRPPALMITCDASHPRALGFINAKADADFGSWIANLSVRFDDDMDVYLDLRREVAAAAHRNGEPGVLFGDVADADNPTPGCRLESTAPCAEVFMAAGERCVFVSVNLAAHVVDGRFDRDAFKRSVRLAVRTADDAVELAAIGAPAIVADRRRIGVGICGLHSALIEMEVPYSESRSFSGMVAETICHTAHSESCELAQRRGPFPMWEQSRWRDPSWVNRKVRRRTFLSAGEWDVLDERILSHGVRNAVIVAFPPTGVVSDLLGVSKSYEPHFDLRVPGGDGSLRPEVANVLDETCETIGEDGQVTGADPGNLLACARQLPPAVHMDIHGAFCGFADEAGSKTVNLPSEATVEDVLKLLDTARGGGLKGLSVFRDGCLSEERE